MQMTAEGIGEPWKSVKPLNQVTSTASLQAAVATVCGFLEGQEKVLRRSLQCWGACHPTKLPWAWPL